jgi:hypothetical protein
VLLSSNEEDISADSVFTLPVSGRHPLEGRSVCAYMDNSNDVLDHSHNYVTATSNTNSVPDVKINISVPDVKT